MGRHSSGSDLHFYRSVVAWFLPWLVIAGVIGVAIWIGVDALGGDDPTPVAAVTPSEQETEAEPSETPSDEASPSPSASKSPKSSPSPTPEQSPTPVDLITEGVSVQILNGSGTAGAENTMQTRLEGLGFEVVAVGQASKAYPETTVFWSFEESRRAARALAARFGWVAQPKPENLSATVDVHVVVGQDEG